jgi:hypothetical protein
MARACALPGRRGAGLAVLGAYDWAAFGAPWHDANHYTYETVSAQINSGVLGIHLPTLHDTGVVFLGDRLSRDALGRGHRILKDGGGARVLDFLPRVVPVWDMNRLVGAAIVLAFTAAAFMVGVLQSGRYDHAVPE